MELKLQQLLLVLVGLVVAGCSSLTSPFPPLQPHSVIRHTIRSTNRNIRAERTASEINCEFLLCFPLFLEGDLPLEDVGVVVSQKSLPIWEASPEEAACESSIIILEN